MINMIRFILLLAALAIDPALAGEPPAEPILRIEAGMHTAIVNKAAVTRDGHLLTVSDDKTARLWSVSGGPSGVLRVPIDAAADGRLYTVAASPVKDKAVVAGDTGFAWDGTGAVYAFDLATGKITGRIANLPGTVHALAYSRDGRFLAIGAERRGGGYLQIRDLAAGTLAKEDDAYHDAVVAAEFLPDGRLVTAASDGKVRLYDAQFTLSAEHTFPPKQPPWRIAISPQGDRIAVGLQNVAIVAILSTDGLKPVGQLSGERGRPGELSAVAWSDNTVFAAGTYSDRHGNKLIRAWDLANKDRAKETAIAVDTVTDLIPLPDHTVAFTTAEPSVGILDPKTLQPVSAWRRPIADFRDAFDGAFAVADDGSAIDFGMIQKGRSPFRFDLLAHTLTKDPPSRTDMKPPLIPPGVKNWRNSLQPVVKGTPIVLDQHEYARSVAATTADGAVILLGADYSLRLLKEGKTVWKLDLQAPAWAVNLSGDGRFALAALGDGTLRWYQTGDGKEVLAFFPMADGRWIVWTPEGYFDHAPGADSLVGYHLNHGHAADPEFVLSGQIHRDFYRPDLVTRKIRGEDLSRQVAKTGDAKTVVTERTPPSLSLLAWCVHGPCSDEDEATTRQAASRNDQVITVDAAKVTLRVGIQDRGGGAGEVMLIRNKAPVITRATTLIGKEAMRVKEYTVGLEPGDNRFTITAYDSHGAVAASAPIQRVIRYATAQPSKPDLYVLSIGINHYRNTQILPKLVNAVSDAEGIAELLAQFGQGLFKKVQPPVKLTEQLATLSNIRQAFEQIAKNVKPEDVVVVFLAGHGIIDENEGKYYFMPYDALPSDTGETYNTPENILDGSEKTALTQAALAKLLSSLPNSRTVVLMDTCYAGAAIPEVLRQSLDRTWMGRLTGRFILAGTTDLQTALDDQEDGQKKVTGHGVFTAVVLDGLRGEADLAASGNHDGRVDVVELSRYALEQVPKKASETDSTHAQRPTGFFDGNDFDFELSVYKEAPGGKNSAAAP